MPPHLRRAAHRRPLVARAGKAFAARGARWRAILVALLVTAGPVRAQVATATIEENFRAAPNGDVVARVLPGAVLDVRGGADDWIEADLEGWVWIRSLQVARRGGFDLVVSADEGENLRAEPRGAILARLPRGARLVEVERRPGWIRVRRPGWVWGASVRVDRPETGSAAAAAHGSDGPVAARVPPAGLPVLAAPGGDTLARARPGSDVQVVGREGGWVRVRIDGWAWLPAPSDSAGASEEPADDPVTPSEVAADPDRFRGRLVTWGLEFISLERAERVRTDFFEGEPFLLARSPGHATPFVYVAVPPDRMPDVEGIQPLELIVVTGRIRSGASVLTGSPIVDLVDIRREGSTP